MSKVEQYPNDAGPDFRLRPLPELIRQTLFVSAGALLVQGATLEQAHAGPQGGNVAAGQGEINKPNASTTVVQQQSHSLVVNWQTFNVAKNELVQFNQPSASASVLNRVLHQTPSQIFGSLNANGKVFLLNPSGVVIGKNARVNVGSLFMSSLDISDDDFMSGNYKFAKKDGSPAGAVINRGLIQAATGGSVTLVGEHVSNEGVIVADAGHVNLAAGRTATVDFNGDGLIRFEVDSEVVENATGADAAVANSGEIHADGGQVLLTASTASQVFDRAVNNRGLIRAGSIQKVGGKVTLSGFGGGVVNTGTVDASGTRGGEVRMLSDSVIEQFGTARAEGSSGDGGLVHLASVDMTLVGDGSLTSVRSDAGKGGLVEVLGDKVGVFGDARVDASGATGGGAALIGGDYQGANADVQNAKRTYVANDVLISANADVAGDGGKVIVWADEVTRFFGKVSAQGGSTSGDGGFVEISGKQGLTFLGDVDTRAANGLAGTLLLDPDFISIIDGAASTGDQDANLSAGNTVAFVDANTAANTVSVGQINAATGHVAINAGQIDFNNSTDIAMGAGLSISFTADNTADANSTGGDNTIRNTGANAFSITTSGAGTIDVDAGGLVDLTGITLNSASAITVNGGGNTTLEVLNTTGNLNVTSTGGSILAASGGSLLTGALVTLSAQTDIGAVGGQAVNTAASNLNLTATAGDIAVSQTGATTIDAAMAGDEIAYAQSTGLLTIAGAVTSGASGITIDPPTDVAINAAVDGGTGSVAIDANNDITFNAGGSIANASTVTLRADVDADNAGAIVDTQATTDITATGLVSLSAGDGIGNGDSLETSAGALSLATTAAASPIDVTEADGLTALTVSTNDSGVSVSFNAAADSLSFIAATDLLTFVAATTPVTFTTSGGIDFSGASSSTTVILSAGGAITDASGGIVTAALLNTTSDGGVTLDTGTHVIEAFTAVNTTGGAISLSNNTAVAALDVQAITQAGGAAVSINESDDAISLSGALSATGSTVTLSAGGTISDAAGGSVTAGVLDTTSVGGTTLSTGTHAVEAFTAVNTISGSILLTNNTTGGTLDVQAVSQAGGGAVSLTETDAITVSGALSAGAGAVTLNAGTDITLNNTVSSSSDVNVLANNDVIFTVSGAVDATGAGNVVVSADADSSGGGAGGALTMDAASTIDAGSGTLDLNADEDITLAGIATSNTTATAAAITSASGNIVDADNAADDPVIAGLAGNANVTVGNGGTVTLEASNGAVGGNTDPDDDIDISFNTGTLRLGLASGGDIFVQSDATAGDSISFTLSPNMATYAVVTPGSTVSFSDDSTDFTLSDISGFSSFGFTANSGDILIDDAAGSGGIVLGAGSTVTLTALAGQIGELNDRASLNITATGVALRSSEAAGGGIGAGSALDLAVSNLAASVAAGAAGAIDLNNVVGGTLTVGTVDGLAGVTNAAGTNVSITSDVAISLAAAVGGAGNTVTLNAGGAILDAAGGIVTAALLDTTSDGGVALDTGTHVLEAFTGVNTTGGAILLSNNTAVAALDVQAISQAGGAAVSISELDDAISLSGALSATGSTVTLSAGGTISDAAGGSVTAGVLDTTSVGGTTLNTGTHAVEAFTASNATAGNILLTNNTAGGTLDVQAVTQVAGGANAVTITESDAISLSGALGGADNTVTLSAGGTITDAAGGIVTAGVLDTTSVGGTTLNTGTHAVEAFTAVNTAGGSLLLTNNTTGGTLDVQAVSQAGGGAVSLTETDAITVSGALSAGAGAVTLNAGTDITLNNTVSSSRDVNVLANNDVIFTVSGAVDATGAGNVVVSADADSSGGGAGGALTMDAASTIDAGSGTLDLNADEDITLAGIATSNTTATAAAITSASGNIVDADNAADDPVIAGLAGNANVTVGNGGTVTLEASNGAVGGNTDPDDDIDISFNTGTLRLGLASGGDIFVQSDATAGDSISFTLSPNMATYAVVTPGSTVSFSDDSTDFTLSDISGFSSFGFTANSGDILIDDAAGSGGIVLGAGSTVTLTALAGQIGELNDRASLNITATGVALRSSEAAGGGIGAGSALDLAVSNLAASVAAGAAGAIDLNNVVGGTLTVGTVDGLAGVTNAAGTNVSITSDVAISLAAAVGGAGNTVTLNAGGAILDAAGGIVTAALLDTTSDGGVALDTGTHVLEAFTGVNTTGGAILLSNNTAVAALDVQAISQAGGAAVSISELDDAISLSGALSATGSTVTLSAGGTISDAAGGSVTAGVLDTTSVGGTTLNTGTHAVEAFTASNATAGNILLTNNTAGGTLDVQAVTQVAGGANAVTITESDAISLSGALGGADNTVTLSAGGTITDAAGGIVTAGVLDTTSVGGTTLNTGTHAIEAFTAVNTISGSILLTNNTAGGTLDVQAMTQVAGGANAVAITETDSIGVSGALNGVDNGVALAAGGEISGAGLITGSSVTLGAAAGITASTEAGTLSVVNGAAGGNVAITESTGVQVNALSNASAGGTLSLTSAGAIDLKSNITTAGGSIALDAGGNALTLQTNVLIDSTNGETAPLGGDINFAAGTTVDGDASGTRSLDLSAGDNGTVTVASAVGGIKPLLSFTVRGGPGTTAVTDRATQADLQAVTTSGGDIIVVANTINANGALTTLGASGGTLTIDGGGIMLGAGLVVGADDITLRGNGGADQDLMITAPLTAATTINLSAARDIIVRAPIDTSTGAAANIVLTADSDLIGNGGVLIEGPHGELRAGNDITLTGSALNSVAVGAATGDSVAVAAGGIVNSGQNAGSGGGNILLAAGTNAPATADIFVQGTVSTAGTTSGGTITMNSARDIRVGSTAIATNGGAVTFQDNVELDAATTVTNNVSGGVANVTFAGTVNGAFDLAVNSSGTTTFTGAVTTGGLTTDGGGSTAINAGGTAVTTTGSQTYNDAVTFAAASTLTSTGGGDLVLAGGGTSTAGDLTLVTDGGFTLGAALTAAGRIVTLDTNSASTVFIGADNAIGLGLSDAEIGLITSSLLRIGQLAGPTNDTVTFNGAVSAAGKTLAVRTTGAGGAITGNPGIASDGFGLHVTTTPQAISLLNASNAITNVALDSGGADISFGQLGSFTVATVDGIVGVNATIANNVNLASSGGSIAQAAGALVIANQLATTSTGGVGFGLQANQVAGFTATNSVGGTIALNDAVGDLDIIGIIAGGADVTLITVGDSAANDSLTQSGAITGTAVLNTTATTGNVDLAGANAVTGYRASAVNGSAIFNNTLPTLALGPLIANTVSVTNSGAITSAGTVTSTAALSLSAGGALVATTVTGGTLALTSSGRIVVDDDGFSTSQLTINPAGARNVRLGGAVTVDSAAISGVDADDLVIFSGPATVASNVATGGYSLAFTNAAPVTLGGGVNRISTGAGDLGLFAGVSPPAGALTLTADTTNLGGGITMVAGSSLTIDSALNLTSKTQLTTNALSLSGAVTGSDLTILRTTSANAVIGGSDPLLSQANLDRFTAYTGTLSLGGERTVAPGSGANLLGNVEITGLLKTAGDIFLAGAGNINFNNSAAGVGRVESTKTDGVVSIAALGSSSVEGSGNITDTGLFNSFANPNRVAVAVGSSGTIELLANNQIGTETGGGAKFNLSAPTLSVAQAAEGEAQVDNAVFGAENSESVQEILAAYSAPGLAISPFIGTGLSGAVLQNLIQTPSSTPKQEKGELGFIDEGVFLLPSTFTNPERAILMPILGDPDFPGDQRPEDPDDEDEWLAFFEDVVREYIASRYPLDQNATDAERAAVEAIVTSELQAIIAFYDAVRERERTQLAAARLESEQPEADSNPDAEQQPDAVESDTPLQQSALPVEGRTLGYIGRSWSGGGIGFEVRG